MNSSEQPRWRNRWAVVARLAALALVPLAIVALFVGAVGQTDSAIDRIPAAIVNEDRLIMSTAADGTEQPVFVGRLLVTELTGADGFDWTITNQKDADAALARGEVYAILTIPSNFSRSILSLSGQSPEQANIAIRTDDAHGYLTGSVAQVVGQTMADTFGTEITAQYLGGIYASFGELGSAFTLAADGADALSTGAGALAGGLRDYTGGVHSLAFGLSQLEDGAAELGGLSAGVSQYTSGISGLSAGLSAVNPGVQLNPGVDAATKAGLQQIVDGLAAAAAGGQTLSSQTSSGIAEFQSGVSQSVGGAYQLADGSPALVSGADALAAGAGELASGLRDGASQLPTSDAGTIDQTLNVVADPVGVSVTTDNAVTEVGQVVATFVVPLGLWVGAFAAFLVLPRLSRRAMASTASSARLTAATFGRAALVTSASAMLLVAVLHTAIGVSISMLPATVLFSLVMALAFTAVHYALTVALGRAGMVVSLLLLAIQLTSTGGVYPIQLLSAPFQAISPFLPLTYAVDGMQAIIAGGAPGTALSAGVALVVFGSISMIIASLALRQRRKAGALGLVPISA